MITLEQIYWVGGAFFAAAAALSVRDRSNPRRWRNAAFWALVATSFLAGTALRGLNATTIDGAKLGDLCNGVIALGLAAIALFGLGQGQAQTTTQEERRAGAAQRGDLLFAPALAIPLITLIGTLAAKQTPWGAALIDPAQATLISLACGALLALGGAMAWLRPPPLAPLQEGRRLLDAVGWAAILPQMLAALGAVFLATGVGEQVGRLISEYLRLNTPTAAVAAYCIGMALFTMVMGNAFAAFPVMTAAIGLPIVAHRFGGDPAVVCAIGMLAGFCGTLTTPMAANFNVVPANLLDLPDRSAALNGVIRAQIPTALPLLGANIALMRLLAFHGH